MVWFHLDLCVTVFPSCLNQFRAGLDHTIFGLDSSSLDSLMQASFGLIWAIKCKWWF